MAKPSPPKETKQPVRAEATKEAAKADVDDELGSMISQFVSPISNKIYMGYDYNNMKPYNHDQDLETVLEREVEQLNGPIYLEFCIHIFQSINFLQTLRIPEEEIEKRMVELKFKKPHCKKLLIFDLDETLSHCVRRPTLERPPQVYLDVTDP